MKRLFRIVGACFQHKEPVLLVGDTGCGKTTVCGQRREGGARWLGQGGWPSSCHGSVYTKCVARLAYPLDPQVCQLYALLYLRPLHIVNCHQHTETADFLGGLRPARSKHTVEEAGSGDGASGPQASKALFEWHDGPLVRRRRVLRVLGVLCSVHTNHVANLFCPSPPWLSSLR